MPEIWFPYLGIEISHLSKVAIRIGNFTIAWYGIIVALGVVCGLLLARRLAKQSGQNPDFYTDFLIYALIFALIGARTYYVAFEWDSYKSNLISVLDFRSGGLAIYGGVIAAIITALIYCKIKKYSVLELMDTAMPGLILGQAIGRWGNFFNQEAFGTYTDSLFAMRLRVDTAAYTTQDLLNHSITKNGVKYIQVHPMFLYESFGCLVILAIMLILFKHRKFKGEVACTYMIGYGVMRAFLETLRTDQLLVWNTNFPVSVFTSAVFALVGIVLMIILANKARAKASLAAMKDNTYAPDIEDDPISTFSMELTESESLLDNAEEAELLGEDIEAEELAEEAKKLQEEIEETQEAKEELTDDDLWS